MTENVNSDLKPCIKGHKSIFSGTRGDDKNWLITCLTCERKRIEAQFFFVYASTEEKAILLWNTRPGEEDARQKQFEVDCRLTCHWCSKGTLPIVLDEGDGPGDEIYMHEIDGNSGQRLECEADDLRRAWKERHDKD